MLTRTYQLKHSLIQLDDVLTENNHYKTPQRRFLPQISVFQMFLDTCNISIDLQSSPLQRSEPTIDNGTSIALHPLDGINTVPCIYSSSIQAPLTHFQFNSSSVRNHDSFWKSFQFHTFKTNPKPLECKGTDWLARAKFTASGNICLFRLHGVRIAQTSTDTLEIRAYTVRTLVPHRLVCLFVAWTHVAITR